jgi:hypothetical protein
VAGQDANDSLIAALAHIHLHLSNNIPHKVLTKNTAAALWLKLESICMSNDLISKCTWR